MVDVIIINGPSCAGKSTICKELCGLSGDKFVHLQIDAAIMFYNSIFYPNFKFVENENGTDGSEWNNNRFARRKIIAGILLSNARELLGRGFKVIIDTVLDGPDDEELAQQYLSSVSEYKTKFVGIYCPLEERLKRFESRPDKPPRTPKMILNQERYFGEPNKKFYDICYDSSKLESPEISRKVLEYVGFRL